MDKIGFLLGLATGAEIYDYQVTFGKTYAEITNQNFGIKIIIPNRLQNIVCFCGAGENI
jgi:hypothetical protein